MKHLLFDLDGTLANTLPLCIAAFREAIEPLAGRSFSDEEIIATFGPSEEGTIRILIPQRCAEALAAYLESYERLHPRWPDPFPGIVPLLQHLKARGTFLGLITGKGPASAMLSLRRFGLAEVFATIETGSPDGPVKDRKIASILQRYSLRHDEVAYIGDTTTDIAAARACGVKALAAAWAPTADLPALRAARPDKVFMSVASLAEYLGVPPSATAPASGV